MHVVDSYFEGIDVRLALRGGQYDVTSEISLQRKAITEDTMPQPYMLPAVPPLAPPAEMSPLFVCTSSSELVDAIWVQLVGELDLAATPQLVTALNGPRHDSGVTVLDLRELTFLSVAGVHAIVDATNRARRDGRRLLLVRAPEWVRRVFALTGTSEEVEVLELDPGKPLHQLPARGARSRKGGA